MKTITDCRSIFNVNLNIGYVLRKHLYTPIEKTEILNLKICMWHIEIGNWKMYCYLDVVALQEQESDQLDSKVLPSLGFCTSAVIVSGGSIAPLQ